MAYTPREIKDRVAVGDDIFIVEDLGDNRVRLIPAPIQVLEPGTPINKALLQPIEDYLATIDRTITTDEIFAAVLQAGDITSEHIAAINADLSKITAGGGAAEIGEDGIKVVSDMGAVRLDPSGGLVFEKPDGTISDFFRTAKVGMAKDGDHVPLDFLRAPKIALTPARIPSVVAEYHLPRPTGLSVEGAYQTETVQVAVTAVIDGVNGERESAAAMTTVPANENISDGISVAWDPIPGVTKYRVYVDGVYEETPNTHLSLPSPPGYSVEKNNRKDPPRANLSGYSEQIIRVDAINVSPSGFDVVARLVRPGGHDGEDITGVSLAPGEYYETPYLDPIFKSNSSYQVKGVISAAVMNTRIFPGGVGYSYTLSLEGKKEGGTWEELSRATAGGYLSRSPGSAYNEYPIAVSFDLGANVETGNWQYRIKLVSYALNNNNWTWTADPRLKPEWHEWGGDKTLATGSVYYVALDGGGDDI